MSTVYEDQIVLFLDLLGFSDASAQLDDDLQKQILALLRSIAELRSEFELQSEKLEDGSSRHIIRPTISTFSDHIVMSYPTDRLKLGNSDFSEMVVINQIQRYVSIIAANALSIGFLIRGGVTRGKLYHSDGVVFGEAMVRASKLEARVAVYPRIVVSDELSESPGAKAPWIRRDFDGLFCIDYFFGLIWHASPPGDDFGKNTKTWYGELVSQLKSNISKLEASGEMTARTKWVWFARQLAEALKRERPEKLHDLGISAEDLDWA